MKTLVFNGWAAGPETWQHCTFPRDREFDYVEQLDGVPEQVMSEFDTAVLVGFSMGCSTALRMLLKHPEKVRGMILISASPCMMERRDEDPPWRGMSKSRFAAFRMGTLMMHPDSDARLFDERNLDRGLDYLKAIDLRQEMLDYAKSVNASGGQRFPVRIFQSDHDGIVRPSNAKFLKSVFPQATVAIVPGAQHALSETVPKLIDAAFNEILHMQ